MALVSPLLRLENNHCHIEESEYVLKKAHKYSELIILYEKKGLHQKGTQRRRSPSAITQIINETSGGAGSDTARDPTLLQRGFEADGPGSRADPHMEDRYVCWITCSSLC